MPSFSLCLSLPHSPSLPSSFYSPYCVSPSALSLNPFLSPIRSFLSLSFFLFYSILRSMSRFFLLSSFHPFLSRLYLLLLLISPPLSTLSSSRIIIIHFFFSLHSSASSTSPIFLSLFPFSFLLFLLLHPYLPPLSRSPFPCPRPCLSLDHKLQGGGCTKEGMEGKE